MGYVGEDGHMYSFVGEDYLGLLVQIANERFTTNTDRISRFRSLLLSKYEQISNKCAEELKKSRDARKRGGGFMGQRREMRAAGSGGAESDVKASEDHLNLNILFD